MGAVGRGQGRKVEDKGRWGVAKTEGARCEGAAMAVWVQPGAVEA